MKLKEVKLQNFLSYDSLDFSFHESDDEEPHIYIITGVNNDTETSTDNSNGSGKSTLVGEAVMYNLFGKNLRGSSRKIKAENSIKFGESTLINEVEYFIDNGAVLKIRRKKERSGKGSLEIKVDGQSTSKRTKRLSEADIRDFLGIDPEIYYQTISFYRDNQNLLAMNYSQKLDFFKRLVNLAIIDEYYQYCRTYKAALDTKIFQIQTKKKSQEDIIAAITNNDTRYQAIIQTAIDKIKEEIAEIESTPIKDESEYQRKLEEILDIRQKIADTINKYQSQIRINQVKIRELKQDVANFTKLKGTTCPTCQQQVTGEYAETIIEARTSEIASLTENIKLLEEKVEALAEKGVKADQKVEAVRKKLEHIKSENTIRMVKLQQMHKQLEEKEKELASVAKSMSTTGETSEYYAAIEKLDKALEIVLHRQEINNFWLNNFAPKSPVRSAIIRKHINYLSDIFEYYLGKLFKNTIIGHMEIDDDGNIDIILKSDGNDVNYWNLSSGERKRTDLALAFALYVYIRNLFPNSPRFLILDEIADSLDCEGIDAVCQVIVEMYQTYKVDIFLISHIPLRLDLFKDGASVKEILVTKNDGCSTAEYI